MIHSTRTIDMIYILVEQMYHHTVDGTNPSPVDMVNILLFTTGFTHPNGGWPWDF